MADRRFFRLILLAGGSSLMLAGAAAAVEPPAANDPASLRAEAFVASADAMNSQAAMAIAKIAARTAQGSGPLAQIEQKRIDATERAREQSDLYNKLIGAEGPNIDNRRRDAQIARDKAIQEIEQLTEQIRAISPSYDELTQPRRLDVPQTQALLRADEVILVIISGEDATYVFGLSRRGLEWAKAPYTVKQIADKVAALRKGLQEGARRGDDLGADIAPVAAYDRKLALELYAALIKPVESVFAGAKVLISISDGPIVGLPIQALVTDEPAGKDSDPQALAATRYLADRYEITTLPAISTLFAQRCLQGSPQVIAEFAAACRAIDPTVKRPAAGAASAAGGGKELVGMGAPALNGPPAPAGTATKGDAAKQIFRDGSTLADPDAIRRFRALPGALNELNALRDYFGDRSTVLTGPDATETAVKKEERTGLADARFVIFSTHGVLSGGARGVGEPGLIFTPPTGDPTEEDDGFLGASEAARLRLAADFVVLSACNTGTSDGSSGEGLSSLSRSFFYAGARSMLVSHWEVNDASTELLIKTTFDKVRHGADRLDALRDAMLAVRNDPAHPQWAAPGFWAAFTPIGVP